MRNQGFFYIRTVIKFTEYPLQVNLVYSITAQSNNRKFPVGYTTAYRFGFNGQERDDEVFIGAYTAEYWEYDSRLGRRWNVDPVVKPWESPYACFSNNPIVYVDIHGDDAQSSNTPEVRNSEGDPDPPREVIKFAKRPSLLSRLWNKAVDAASAIAEYVPVIGGIKHAVQSAMVGDWKGAAIGLGEAIVDGVLLVTTGGIGNIAKAGLKGGVKLGAKMLAKEMGENYASEKASDGLAQLGLPGYLQVAAGVLLGVHGKPKMGKGMIEKKGRKLFGDGFRIDRPNVVDGKATHSQYRELEMPGLGTLLENGIWKHGGRELTKKEKEFILEIGWKLPE